MPLAVGRGVPVDSVVPVKIDSLPIVVAPDTSAEVVPVKTDSLAIGVVVDPVNADSLGITVALASEVPVNTDSLAIVVAAESVAPVVDPVKVDSLAIAVALVSVLPVKIDSLRVTVAAVSELPVKTDSELIAVAAVSELPVTVELSSELVGTTKLVVPSLELYSLENTGSLVPVALDDIGCTPVSLPARESVVAEPVETLEAAASDDTTDCDGDWVGILLLSGITVDPEATVLVSILVSDPETRLVPLSDPVGNVDTSGEALADGVTTD